MTQALAGAAVTGAPVSTLPLLRARVFSSLFLPCSPLPLADAGVLLLGISRASFFSSASCVNSEEKDRRTREEKIEIETWVNLATCGSLPAHHKHTRMCFFRLFFYGNFFAAWEEK